MAEWLELTFQWHEMYCHNQNIMGSDPDLVNIGERSISAKF